MSTVDGLHVPLILLVDIVGSVGIDPPAQIVREVPKLKVGVMLGLTVTVNVTGIAQTPAVGIKV